MNKKTFILFFLTILVISYNLNSKEKNFIKNIAELKKYRIQVLSGNKNAGNILWNYYALENYDENETLLWNTINMENNKNVFAYVWNESYSYLKNKSSDRGLYLYFLSEKYMKKSGFQNNELYKIRKMNYKKEHEKYPNFKFAVDSDYKQIEITENNIDWFKKGAFNGSGLAAYKLALYYLDKKIKPENCDFLLTCCIPSSSIHYPDEQETSLYWYRIGTQNNNEKCMQEYADLLISSINEEDRIRGEYWKRRLKKNL